MSRVLPQALRRRVPSGPPRATLWTVEQFHALGELGLFEGQRAPLPAGLGAAAYRTRLTFGPGDAVTPLAAPTAPVPVADLLP